MVESFTFSGEGMTEAEAFRRYQTLYSDGADVSRLPGPLNVQVQSWRLDRILLFDRRLAGVGHERHEPRVRHNDFSHFTVNLVRDGHVEGSPASGFERAETGEVFLQDMRRATRTANSCVHLLTASVARDLIEAAVGSATGLHGRVVCAAAAGLLGDYMKSLAERAPGLEQDVGAPLSRVFVEFLALALNPTGGGARTAVAREDFARREGVQRLIDANLENPDLATGMIVRETGVSRATLYRLMEPHGGVARFISGRRIARVRALLDDPSNGQTLAQLADRFAFSSPSRLTKKFTQILGLSPTAYQGMVQDPDRQIEAFRQRWAAWMIEVR